MANEFVPDKGGSAPTPPRTPAQLAAHGKSRDSFTRTIFGGSVLVVLCLFWGIGVFLQLKGTDAALGVIATGLGFLLGSRKDESA